MSQAAYYREQAAKALRLLNAMSDRLTRERLSTLAQDYLAKAELLEAGSPADPPNAL